MTADTPRSLLERRLVIVTGKGGSGKTTVSAALALGAARAGRRALVVEVGANEQITALLDPGGPAAGHPGRAISPHLWAMRIDPFEALAEYLGLQLGVRQPVDLVLRNRAFRQFLTAAPGWRELITLGKIWHLSQLEPETGAPTQPVTGGAVPRRASSLAKARRVRMAICSCVPPLSTSRSSSRPCRVNLFGA